MKIKVNQTVLLVIITPVLGFMSFLWPQLVNGVFSEGGRTFSIGNMVEKMMPVTLLLLFILGVVLGAFCRRRDRLWIIGPLTMAVFPITAVIEMLLNPNSHNLFPIEFLLYIITAIPPFVGAYLGHFLAKKIGYFKSS